MGSIRGGTEALPFGLLTNELNLSHPWVWGRIGVSRGGGDVA